MRLPVVFGRTLNSLFAHLFIFNLLLFYDAIIQYTKKSCFQVYLFLLKKKTVNIILVFFVGFFLNTFTRKDFFEYWVFRSFQTPLFQKKTTPLQNKYIYMLR